ncbi:MULTISPECIES: hypothetical protein [unclassified Adlercreutzia]|uniref:hypothetical protein n=1 Tax=unclassified Adlercreutzia TaxID=2636013 RepID=UPI0013EE2F93|nr:MULTISPECIES: hypothetical protein [unclassified Adlercreutzia]
MGKIDELDQTARGTAATVMVSIRMPVGVKKKVEERAKANGVSQTDYIVEAINEGVSLRHMLHAVEGTLRKDPPPFSDEDWKPSRGECMTFIQNAVQEAINEKLKALE